MLDTLLRNLPMVRLSAAAFAALMLLGCNGLISGGTDEQVSPEEQTARRLFTEKAKPVLDQVCIGCHAGSDPTVAFIAGSDAMMQRASLLGWDPQVVNLEAASSSRLLTKGPHSGPALQASQQADLLEWIGAERDAAGATGNLDTGLETRPFTVLLCTAGSPGDPSCPITYVDLSPLVQGWAGARLKFVAKPLSSDLYVTNLELEGGTDGVYIEHPLFASWPVEGGDPIPDTLDRFFSVKMNVMPGMPAQQIAGGTAAFVNFKPTNQLTVHFKVIEKYRVEEGTGSGSTASTGCKQLASFKANARGQLQTNCANCHGNAGNAGATSAMNIVGVGSQDDAVLQGVCDQVRTRINFQDTNLSGFFLAPNPGATGHANRFKFGTQAAFDTFKAAVDMWVQAEKTSL